jgi:Na+-driven multidrug efflux pump
MFQGFGKGLISLLLTVTRVGLIGVPMAYILSRYYGLTGVWLGLISGGVISSILASSFAVYYFKTKLNSFPGRSNKNQSVNLDSNTAGH